MHLRGDGNASRGVAVAEPAEIQESAHVGSGVEHAGIAVREARGQLEQVAHLDARARHQTGRDEGLLDREVVRGLSREEEKALER